MTDDKRQTPQDLRTAATRTEGRLWYHLRAHRLNGLHFRRQHKVGPYVVDFFCDSARLVVEVDGPVHNYRAARDANRDEWMAAQGYAILRFDNIRVWRNLTQVLEKIAKAARFGQERLARLEAEARGSVEGETA